MTVTDVTLRFTDTTGPEGGDLLVLGHSLGTSAALWEESLPFLRERFRVVCWELPGHGGAEPAQSAFGVEDLTNALIAQLDAFGAFHYAGVSIGGCVGLDLCLRYPNRIQTATVISSGARVDSPALMRTRAEAARADGVASLANSFRRRWFAPTTSTATAERMLELLRTTDSESYALAAEALADFDVWEPLPQIATPILAVGGEDDEAVPVDRSIELAGRVQRGTVAVVSHAAHSLAAEQPEALAKAILAFATTDHEA